jgi:Ca2+-binding RTX toxin-like protein
MLSQTGGSSITLFGGTGNDTLQSTGGSSITLAGGTGNDTLQSSGGTGVAQVGGSGNAMLSQTGGSSITLFGGTGNDTLQSTGGSSITLVGGTGNDTLGSSGGAGVVQVGGAGNDLLSQTGGSSITLFGGTGNDTLQSTGGSSITMTGGTGNDSLSSSGGAAVSVLGGTGDDTLSQTGATGTTLVGGTGNDSLSSSGGSSVVLLGGSGNDTLTGDGGVDVLMQGGTGNSMLSQTGGSSITLFGGTGNDTLQSTGGSSITLAGGTGNDTLGSTVDPSTGMGGVNVLMLGGASGMLSATGGSSITLFGGAGNDTLSADGVNGASLYGLEGDDTYLLTGTAADPLVASVNTLATFGQNQPQDDSQTQADDTLAFPGVTGVSLDLSAASTGPVASVQQVAPGVSVAITGTFRTVVGTPGDDSIRAGAGNTEIDGGGGNDTLVGGSGNTTLLAGTGNDSLAAGAGNTTFVFNQNSAGDDVIDPPADSGTNTLDFSAFGSGVNLDLGSTATQAAGAGLSLTLQAPGEIKALVDSAYDDNITGNASGDTFTLGAGNDTITGGGGADAFYFKGSHLGSDTINETSTDNTLNFYGFGGPVNLDLTQAGQQTLDAAASSSLTLTLTNPSAFSTVVGTPYADNLVGNDNANETIIGGGGEDSLLAGSGNDYVQGYVEQVVYLDFPTPAQTLPGDHVYTPLEEAAVQQGLEADYGPFNYFFTQDQATAEQVARTTGGQYATLEFDAAVVGGSADELDPGNLDLGGTAQINVTPFLGLASEGLVPPTSANVVGLTTTIAAHELGHLSGLQHQDALGPIGTGISGGVDPSSFYPAYPAYATTTSLTMAPSADAYTLSAVVAGSGQVSGTPQGLVDFYDVTAGADLGTALLDGTGAASVTIQVPPAAGDVIVATYISSNSFTNSTTSETITPIATTTSLTVIPGEGFNVMVTSPGGGTPTGSVDVFDETLNEDLSYGYVPLEYAGGDAGSAFIYAPQAGEGDVITATYSGGGAFAASSAGLTVPPAPTTLTLSDYSTDYYTYLYVSVSGGNPSGGTVDFQDASTGTDLGSSTYYDSAYYFQYGWVPQEGDILTATYTSPNGSVSLTASLAYYPYAYDSAVATAGGQPTSTTVLTTTVAPGGQGVVLTANVQGGDGGTPAGTVDFFDASSQTDLGTATLDGNADASLTAQPAPGDLVVATYTSFNGYAGSSVGQSLVPTATTTSLVSGLTADGVGVTFTARVAGMGGNIPAGTVDFIDETTGADLTPGGLTLDDTGSATTPELSVVGLSGHDVEAVFAGGAAFAASSAGQTVGPDAFETPNDIMASPDSVGSTLLDAAGPTFVGERDAVNLAFNDTGAVVQQADLPTAPVSVPVTLPITAPAPQGASRSFTINQAYVLGDGGTLPGLAVPDTLPAGVPGSAETFQVTATAVDATLLSPDQADYYTFNGQADQEMTFQVISNNNTQNPNPILPELLVVGPTGQVLGYNVHEFESNDSTLLDVTLPTAGAYYVGVDSVLGQTAGNYQLFMYSFATSAAAAASGDTLVGGVGNDTLVGSSGDDTFVVGSPDTTILAGSGNDTIQSGYSYTLNYPTTSATTLALSADAQTVPQGEAATFTAALTAANGGTPTGTVSFFDTTTATSLGTATLSVVDGVAEAQLTAGLPRAGDNVITATYASDGTFQFSYDQLTEVVSTGLATPTVSVTDASGTYAGQPFTATATVNGGSTLEGVALTLDYVQHNSNGSSTDLGSQAPSDAGSYTVTASFAGSADYGPASNSADFTISQATPQITWTTPAAIPFGTALCATQLDATANAAGTFSYSPAAGTLLGAGQQTLTATFTPTDATDYTTATATVSLTVNQATPQITWTTPAAIPYGTALSATQLDATASVAGTFSYSPAAGTVLAAGQQTLTATFTPSDTTDYTTATATVSLTVNQATPQITWTAPAAIPYGTALSATQLDATASAAGTFSYSPAAGTVLTVGTHQALGVTFTPTDATDYTTAAATVYIDVTQATPQITWTTPAAIPYGTALSATQLDATASVAGTFSYCPAAGTVLAAGQQTLTATFTPSDTTDYADATASVLLTVNAAGTTTSVVSSTNNSSTYGQQVTFTATVAAVNLTEMAGESVTFMDGATTLGSGTLNASGVASFTTAATQLSAGNNQPITAVYAGDGDYQGSTGTLQGGQTVQQAGTSVAVTSSSTNNTSTYGQAVTFTATVSAVNPAELAGENVTFKEGSTTLGSGTLNASGVASFTTAATQLSAGNNQPITAVYAGDGDYQGSTGTLQGGQTVAPAGTSVSLTSSSTNNTSTYGQQVTFTATVTPNIAAAGAPAGTVSFYNGTLFLGRGVLSGNGVATFSTSLLAIGPDAIKAVYDDANDSGGILDPDFLTSSASLTQTVTGAGPVDITNQTSFTHAGGSLVRQASGISWVQAATLTNKGTTSYQGPIAVLFNNLAAGTVVNGATINGVFVAAQQDSSGLYYIDVLAATFTPGQMLSMSLQFNQFPGAGYTVKVFAGAGTP